MALELERQVEVETVFSVLDDLDYYRLLRLRGGASLPDVEKAYTEQSQRFHPDRFFGVKDAALLKKVTTIFKKLNEGYQVLKDPELKKMYDEKLARVSWFLVFVGFNVTFFTQFFLGTHGMPRRYASYVEEFQLLHQIHPESLHLHRLR